MNDKIWLFKIFKETNAAKFKFYRKLSILQLKTFTQQQHGSGSHPKDIKFW